MPRPDAETIYVFQMTFNETTGLPVAQTQLDRAKTILNKILSLYTLNDGSKLLNYEFSLINSYTDPKWLETQARDNFDNSARTTFYNASTPYNGLALTTTYSVNGKNRIKASFSKYAQGSSDNDLFEEIIQQFSNMDDPVSGSLKGHVLNLDGSVSDLGKEMFRTIYFLNQGTTTTKIQ